jgi:hypothetical protein
MTLLTKPPNISTTTMISFDKISYQIMGVKVKSFSGIGGNDAKLAELQDK